MADLPVSESTPTPSPKPSRFRLGVPQLTIVLTTLLLIGLGTWPHGQLEEMYRNMGMMMIGMISVMILSVWIIAASGWRWLIRLAIVGGFWTAFFAGFNTGTLYFDGDSALKVRSPFRDSLKSQLARFEASTATQANREKVDLTVEKPTDSPAYRGRDRNGIVTGPELIADWNTTAPKPLWRRPGGGGFAGFAVVNDYLIGIEQRDDQETTVCYDATNGRERWTYTVPVSFKETLGGNGPRATPTIDRGDVYTLGAKGHLACLDGSTGKAKWSVEILEGNENLIWGMCGAPLIVDDLVIVNPGAQVAGKPALVAYQRQTGKVAWESGKARTGYASPMLATLGGVRQILIFDGEGLAGYDPTNGTELWRVLWSTNQGINVGQPIVMDERTVFIASGYGVGGGWVEVTPPEMGNGWKAKIITRTKNTVMRCKFTSPIRYQGHIYGLNDGKLECIDERTGEVKWKDDRRPKKGEAYGHGQILLADKHLIVQTEFNEIVLVDATPDELRELGRLKVLEGTKSWNTPSLVDGRLYVRSDEEIAAIDLRK